MGILDVDAFSIYVNISLKIKYNSNFTFNLKWRTHCGAYAFDNRYLGTQQKIFVSKAMD
jgi:hypothetical protein